MKIRTKISILNPKIKLGFTLIELLIVIAIIALLAAILFPVFGRARENARRSNCQSNLKQIGLGITQYNQDYDEMMPLHEYDSNGNGTINGFDMHWVDGVYPYIKSTQIFTCPSRTSGETFISYQTLPGRSNDFYGTYTLNYAYYGGRTDTSGGKTVILNNPVGAKIAAIANTAETILAVEGVTTTGTSGWDKQQILTVDEDSEPGEIRVGASIKVKAPHLQTTNVLYCDGHVKTQKLGGLTERKSYGSKVYYPAWTIQED